MKDCSKVGVEGVPIFLRHDHEDRCEAAFVDVSTRMAKSAALKTS
jgi:hypothetical protein